MSTNRANRTTVEKMEDGWVCKFYRTHKFMDKIESTNTSWVAPKDAGITAERESFRAFAQDNAEELLGLNWKPELQCQAWDRKYWKYETDSQVEEDAIELMSWTIASICEKAGLKADMGKMELDSIVPTDSELSYVEDGKYVKNGNWAVAQVNLEVRATIDGRDIDIIYPIEMRSGQLTKIKLTVDEIKAMVADNMVA